MPPPLNVGVIKWFLSLLANNRLSYFELNLPLSVVASVLPSHLHVMARLISVEGV